MIELINVADLKDPKDPNGRSYREVNREQSHRIQLGTLVELETGERLYVKHQGRDCDETPLYSIGLKDDDADYHWTHGYGEESLTVVSSAPGERNE